MLNKTATIWHPFTYQLITGRVHEIVQVLHDECDDRVLVFDYALPGGFSRLYLDETTEGPLGIERQIRRCLSLRTKTIRRLPSPRAVRGRGVCVCWPRGWTRIVGLCRAW
jgi:hypothetical protein